MPERIVVVYHSVASNVFPAVKGSFPIEFERFVDQIMSLKKAGYRFDSIRNFREESKDKRAFIMSDDGTMDFAITAGGFLNKMGIPFTVAVITGPLEKTPVYPVTHRVQIRLAIDDYPPYELNQSQMAYIDEVYHYETNLDRRYAKGFYNLIATPEQAEKLLGEPKENELHYLRGRFTPLDYYTFFENCTLVNHTRKHTAYSKDYKNYFWNEIIEAHNLLMESKQYFMGAFVPPLKPLPEAKIESINDFYNNDLLIFDGEGIWDEESKVIPRIDAKKLEGYNLW